MEDASHSLDGAGIARHLVDVVSRGGNLLLNVGPTADGRIPELQRRALEQLGDWMDRNGDAVHDTGPVPADLASPGPGVWWTGDAGAVWAVVDAPGEVTVSAAADRLDLDSARLGDGTPVTVRAHGSGIVLGLTGDQEPGPTAVRLERR